MSFFLTGTVADRQQVWPLEGQLLKIGRSSRCEIQIADGTVSKEHAELTRAGEGWRLRDMGSRNGTRVNGVEARVPIELHAGDRVEIGQLRLRFVDQDPAGRVRFNESTSLNSSVQLRAAQVIDRSMGGITPSADVVRVLAEAGRQLVLPRPLKETCEEILQFVERVVPGTRHVVLIRNEGETEPVQMAARTRSGRSDLPLALSRSILHMVLDECTSVLTTDTSMDPRFQAQQSIVTQGVRCAMAVPLFDNERVLGVVYVDSQDLANGFGQEQLELLTLLANMAAVKITNARLLQAEQARARLAQEAATATRIQRAMLHVPPAVPGLSVEAFLQTCHEVGGDLYDVFVRKDGSVLFLVGDVSGKGMGASLLMSSFLSSARVLYDVCPELSDLSSRLNVLMCRNSDSSHFITAFMGCLDPGSGVLRYVNAGHPPAVAALDGTIRVLPSGSLPWGVLEDAVYTEAQTVLEPGELLALFTDGIPEARHGDELFEEERFYELLRETATSHDLGEVRRKVVERVEEFIGGEARGDDITLLLLRRERAD